MSESKPREGSWYTTTQVGRMIGFSRDTVVALIEDGTLRATKGKREHRIRGEEVKRYLTKTEGA